MRAIAPTTPTSNRSSGPGTSLSGWREATITSMRLPRSTSSTSATERSWPTASGISVSGQRDRLAQRQDGQRARHGARRADLDVVLLARGVGDLDRSGQWV